MDRFRSLAGPMILVAALVLTCGAEPVDETGRNRVMVRSPRQSTPVRQVPSAPIRFRPAATTLASPASFTPDMPLGRAIDILRHSTQPPLNMVVLWRDLDANAGIDKTTPIGIDGLPGLKLRQYLQILLTSLSATAPVRIGYVVNHGVITVGTVDSLPTPKRVTRVYDISDLVAPPSTGMGFGMMPGMMMPGLGGMSYGGAGGGYAPGYGNYGMTQGYNPLGGFGGFMNGTQSSGGVYRR